MMSRDALNRMNIMSRQPAIRCYSFRDTGGGGGQVQVDIKKTTFNRDPCQIQDEDERGKGPPKEIRYSSHKKPSKPVTLTGYAKGRKEKKMKPVLS